MNKHKKYSNKAMRNSQPRNFLATINPRVLGGPRPSEKLTWRVPIPPNLPLPSAVFALKEDFFWILCTANITAQLQPLDLFLPRIDPGGLNYYRAAVGGRISCKFGNGKLVGMVGPLAER